MTRVYYREAVGALMVFDVTRASTFDAVLKWKDDLDSKVRGRRPTEEVKLIEAFVSLLLSHLQRCKSCFSIREITVRTSNLNPRVVL